MPSISGLKVVVGQGFEVIRMPSQAYRLWKSTRARELDEVQTAHALLGGTARGRRYTTQQINRAYAVLLASQFQGFARDLHTESVDYLVTVMPHPGWHPRFGEMQPMPAVSTSYSQLILPAATINGPECPWILSKGPLVSTLSSFGTC